MVGVCENKFRILCYSFMIIQRLTSLGSLFYGNSFKFMREKERVLGEGERKTNLRATKSVGRKRRAF